MNHTHWIEIDCDALINNLKVIQNSLSPDVKLLAVVKADAYGLGADFIAHLFEKQGVNMLGVTHLEEGIYLRQKGVKLPVLLFTPLLPHEAAHAVSYHLTPTIVNKDALVALKGELEPNDSYPIHLKVETGMGRNGLKNDAILPFCRQVKADFPQLQIEGIYSHFAQAAKGDSFTQQQFVRFNELVGELEKEDYKIPLKHIASSVAAFDLPETQLDMVRVGTLLYGQHPLNMKARLPLKDPWQAKAKIVQVQNLAIGDSVGYGREYILKKDSRIGVIPYGFADGLGLSPITRPKSLLDLIKALVKNILAFLGKGSQTLGVSHGGKKLPFVGRLGMQFSMIDLENSHLKVGDQVEVPLGRTTASNYLPRIYLKEGRIVGERSFGKAGFELWQAKGFGEE